MTASSAIAFGASLALSIVGETYVRHVPDASPPGSHASANLRYAAQSFGTGLSSAHGREAWPPFPRAMRSMCACPFSAVKSCPGASPAESPTISIRRGK